MGDMILCHLVMSRMSGGPFRVLSYYLHIYILISYFNIVVITCDLFGEGFGGEHLPGSGYKCHG